MSHFVYQMLKSKEEKLGVWIKPHSNPELLKKIKKIGRVKRNESVERIVVKDINSTEVYLEIWLTKLTLRKIFRVIFNLPYEVERHIVFGFWETEDVFWLCEGDLGTGLKDF